MVLYFDLKIQNCIFKYGKTYTVGLFLLDVILIFEPYHVQIENCTCGICNYFLRGKLVVHKLKCLQVRNHIYSVVFWPYNIRLYIEIWHVMHRWIDNSIIIIFRVDVILTFESYLVQIGYDTYKLFDCFVAF